MEVLAGKQTPLRIAVCLGLMPLAEEALLCFKEGTYSTQSPLHLAAQFMSRAYKILTAKGRPWLLTNPDEYGNTPLHQATIFDHSSMMNGLTDKFAGHTVYSKEVNMKNKYGNTPLHLAVQFDHPKIVRHLVENSADPAIKNNALATASDLGAELGRAYSLAVLKGPREIQQDLDRLEPEPLMPTEELAGKPGRSLWRTLGRCLGRLWGRQCEDISGDETPEESGRGMAWRVVEGIMGETGDIDTGDRGATSKTLLASDLLYYSAFELSFSSPSGFL